MKYFQPIFLEFVAMDPLLSWTETGVTLSVIEKSVFLFGWLIILPIKGTLPRALTAQDQSVLKTTALNLNLSRYWNSK